MRVVSWESSIVRRKRRPEEGKSSFELRPEQSIVIGPPGRAEVLHQPPFCFPYICASLGRAASSRNRRISIPKLWYRPLAASGGFQRSFFPAVVRPARAALASRALSFSWRRKDLPSSVSISTHNRDSNSPTLIKCKAHLTRLQPPRPPVSTPSV